MNIFQGIGNSFTIKITISVGIILFAVLSFYFFFFIQQTSSIFRAGLVDEGHGLLESVMIASEFGLEEKNGEGIGFATQGIFEKDKVVFIGVYDNQRKEIFFRAKIESVNEDMISNSNLGALERGEFFQREIQAEGMPYLEFITPVYARKIPDKNIMIGFARMGVSLQSVVQKQREAMILYSFVSVIAFLIGGMLTAYLAKRSTVGLQSLMHGVQNIQRGKFDVDVEVQTTDEIGQLGIAFNQMTKILREAKERDKVVSRMKSEFLSIAAHQLRTPLSAMKWILRMTIDGDIGKLSRRQTDFLEKGFATNERMVTLVNDLLNAVRIEEGRFDYRFLKQPIWNVVEKVIQEKKISAESKKINLSVEKTSRTSPKAMIDAQRLRLAISNVLDNAIQYTPRKGKVHITLVTEEDHALIVVRDTGIGIPETQRSRLFTRFFRAANAVRVVTDGNGLGLFITKNIIEKHKGKIWIESKEGVGTTIFIKIPTIT